VSFWDALFGRAQPRRPDMQRIFALATAAPSLADAAGLEGAGRAGVCLKPVTSGEFAATESELAELARMGARDLSGSAEVSTDELGYRWILFTDPELDALVNLVHLVGSTLEEKGFGEQLLAAVFRFRDRQAGRTCYLIYNYKRGSFYPFAPTGDEARDNALEFHVSAALSRELPMERDVSRWFPVWRCPV
jgi:hypothetical protein